MISSGKCQWVRGNGTVCDQPTNNKRYCYTHAPLASVRYTRGNGLPEPLDGQIDASLDRTKTTETRDVVDDLRRKWRAELEQDYNGDKGKAKGRILTAKDFPNYHDGIWYNNIQEYYEMHTAEMPGVDQQPRYDKRTSVSSIQDWPRYAPVTRKEKKKEPSNNGPDPLKGKNGYYILKDEIAHMRYVVYRDDLGFYFAVFISLFRKEDTKADFKDVMSVVAKTKLPTQMPLDVEGIGSFHTSKPHATYWGAEAHFTSGGENLNRIKERMRKVADPNWIPPNLRKMAVEATYNPKVWTFIPKSEHDRLKTWLNAGCPGWYSKMPKGYKSKGNYHYSSYDSGFNQTPLFSSALDKHGANYASTSYFSGAEWDGSISMWVSKRKRTK